MPQSLETWFHFVTRHFPFWKKSEYRNKKPKFGNFVSFCWHLRIFYWFSKGCPIFVYFCFRIQIGILHMFSTYLKNFGSYYFALGTPNGSMVESRVGVEGYFTEASAMAASVVAGSSTTLTILRLKRCAQLSWPSWPSEILLLLLLLWNSFNAFLRLIFFHSFQYSITLRLYFSIDWFSCLRGKPG